MLVYDYAGQSNVSMTTAGKDETVLHQRCGHETPLAGGIGAKSFHGPCTYEPTRNTTKQQGTNKKGKSRTCKLDKSHSPHA